MRALYDVRDYDASCFHRILKRYTVYDEKRLSSMRKLFDDELYNSNTDITELNETTEKKEDGALVKCHEHVVNGLSQNTTIDDHMIIGIG